MSGSVNKVILIGNLGRDPEIRSFQNGGKVANLRIATSEQWKDRNSGERRERTEWHTVTIFAEGLVNLVEQFTRKGSKLYIEGQLETRKWQDQSGQDRYSTEVVVRPFAGTLTMLDTRSGEQGGGRSADGGQEIRERQGQGQGQQQSYGGSSSRQGASAGGFGGRSVYDDEIPFAPSVL